MGAGLSNPIDDDKRAKIQECITNVLTPFGKQYPRAYAVALYQKVKGDVLAEKTENPYQLLERPKEEASTELLKTGWLTKEGAVRKSWKKRYFIVRPDYKVEYYEKEEDYKKGAKPKGIISPAGYKVVTDVNSDLIKKAEKLAEKLKLDPADIPKPKQYPPFTFGVVHDKRRNWYITADNQEQMDEWVEQFKVCCRNAEGLNDNEEVAKAAYESAFDATREANGYWDWWNFQGSESDNLTDLITRNVSYSVLDEVFGGLSVPSKMKNMVMEKVEDAVGSAIGTAVSAAWSAASSGVKASRKTLEEKVKSNATPVIEAESKFLDKVTEAISGKVNPAVDKHVAPKLGKVLPVLVKPIKEAFEKAFELFITHSTASQKELADNNDAGSVFSRLSSSLRWTSTLKPCYELLDKISEGLEKVEDIPGLKDADTLVSLIGTAKDAVESLLQRAAYTLEKTVKDKVSGGASAAAATEEARGEVLKKFKHDARVKTADAIKEMILGLVKPPVAKDVLDPCKEAIAPITDSIPDMAKDFINPDDKIDEVVENIIGGAVSAALEPALPEF